MKHGTGLDCEDHAYVADISSGNSYLTSRADMTTAEHEEELPYPDAEQGIPRLGRGTDPA